MDKYLINENEQSLDECIYCHSFCKSSCPSFDISGNDCFLPRNISYFYSLFKKGDIEITENLVKIFYSCTACSLCEINCVYDNKDFINNIIKIRSEIFKKHRDLIPEEVLEIVNNLNKSGNIFCSTGAGIDVKHLKLDKSSENVFFTGCIIKYKLPGLFEDISRFLGENNIKFNLINDALCCGAPYLFAGDIESATRKAIGLKDAIKNCNAKNLVMFCPAGYDYIKNWCKKLGVDIGARVIFYTDFLNDALKKTVKKINALPEQLSRDPALKIKNVFFLEAGEFRNEIQINKSAKDIILGLKNTGNSEFISENNFYTNCGGVLNCFKSEDIKKYVNDIIYKSKSLKSDVIVTVSPICYYYLKEYSSGIEVKELISYLIEQLKINDNK